MKKVIFVIIYSSTFLFCQISHDINLPPVQQSGINYYLLKVDSTSDKIIDKPNTILKKPFVIETSIIGHFLFNIKAKYRFTKNFNIGIELPIVLRSIWEEGDLVLSGGFSSVNYLNKLSLFYIDNQIGIKVGKGFVPKASSDPAEFVGAYYHNEIGMKNGFHLFLELEPFYFFKRHKPDSFTGELGIGWNF
jgi:hypothetical protein